MDGNFVNYHWSSNNWFWIMKIVISLGGSVLNEELNNITFLKGFIKLIKGYLNHKFVIFCGGGDIARKYIKYGRKLSLNSKSLDWIGIYATRLNAIMLKNLFLDYSNKEILINPTKSVKFDKNIVLAAGWKPGWSTDYDAVLVAKKIKADKLINITNISHVFDKDPKKFKNAKKIKKIRWKKFRQIVGSEWTPGLNMPFDPIASKEAEKSKIKVMIINNDLSKLRNCLDSKKFDGTLIY